MIRLLCASFSVELGVLRLGCCGVFPHPRPEGTRSPQAEREPILIAFPQSFGERHYDRFPLRLRGGLGWGKTPQQNRCGVFIFQPRIYSPRVKPYSSASVSASQLASMTFVETPTVDQLEWSSADSIKTRTRAAVPSLVLTTRTLKSVSRM